MFRENTNISGYKYDISKSTFPENLYTKLLELVKNLNGLEILNDKERMKIESKVYRNMKYYRKI